MLVDNGKYYLYRHIRVDKNEPFYIGIGTKGKKNNTLFSKYNRAFQKHKSHRGKIWQKIVSKTDYNVEILFETNDYNFLLNQEMFWINLYGRIINHSGTLVNLSIGGNSSANGIKWSEKSRLKLSKSKLGYKVSVETIKKRVATRKKNYVYTDEHKRKISESNKRHPSHQPGFKWSKEQILKREQTKKLKRHEKANLSRSL